MRRNTRLRPMGHVFSTDFDGGMQECDTYQCCHCGRHWEVVPGSGRKRGFCTLCNDVTCGAEKCDRCVPMEQQLENLESGKDQYHKPIFVSFEGVNGIPK